MDRPPGQNEVAIVERKTEKARFKIKIYSYLTYGKRHSVYCRVVKNFLRRWR